MTTGPSPRPAPSTAPEVPSTSVRVAMAQINPCVGDLAGNSAMILAAVADAVSHRAEIIVLPEMALTGYPIEDLAMRPAFRDASRSAVDELAVALESAGFGEALVVVGYLDHDEVGTRDAAAAIHRGEVVARVNKHHLPNYGVFDEQRWFAPGTETTVLHWRGVRVGVVICEDIWRDGGPVAALAETGIDLLLVPTASPFEQDKDDVRMGLIRARAAQVQAPVVYVNIVGGQDDLVFDGQSVAVAADGELLARTAQFVSEVAVFDLVVGSGATGPTEDVLVEVSIGAQQESRTSSLDARSWQAPVGTREFLVHERVLDVSTPATGGPPLLPGVAPALAPEAAVWNALVLGLRDYTEKIGFNSVILGLSGGIDSAVVAAIAVDAIGADRVHAVSMPSVYSSDHSKDDAAEMARRTGLHYRVEPIADMVAVFVDQLGLTGLAEENVQARCRGVTLMALSNQEGHLVLATGNKTELACGYSTIYGDAVGGFAPLKDVFKTWVWRIAEWRNAYAQQVGEEPPIPENSIIKPPSAELRPGQLDSDSLPDYPLLDAILDGYVETDVSAADLVAAGFEAATVSKVIHLVDRAEWKRRQYPPGTKITEKAFGRDRRVPIISKWSGD
jgi:NAD+ synthase (glutamine-hydrolysing)